MKARYHVPHVSPSLWDCACEHRHAGARPILCIPEPGFERVCARCEGANGCRAVPQALWGSDWATVAVLAALAAWLDDYSPVDPEYLAMHGFPGDTGEALARALWGDE